MIALMNKKCLAMVLAGGGGERLKPLTKKLAKPAVLFGGKYRIIDFALSNCINSGIYTVGIVVQYEPLVLNSHINSGGIWDMHNGRGHITILTPYMNENGGCWYNGTANAIYQNLEYVEMYNPEYVIILSADQVYKMDYSLMLDEHIKKSADVTVAVQVLIGKKQVDLVSWMLMIQEKLLSLRKNQKCQKVILHLWEYTFLIVNF
jgi:glucose-1-phosphate adenylyltransferase